MTRKRAGTPGRPGGYTLVEIAVTLAMAGIVASLAVPSLGALARNERRTAAVNELLVTLQAARSEAIKRGGRPIVICGLAPPAQACTGHDWSAGWALGTWNDADGDATVDPAEFRPLRHFTPPTGGGLTVMAGNFTASPPIGPAGTILVKAFGRRTSNGTITICDDRGPGAARAVIVSSLARARASSTRANGKPLTCP